MPAYEVAGVTTVTTSGAATVALKAGATTDAILWELHWSTNAATATTLGLYRSTAAGTASTSLTPVSPWNSGTAALSRVETAWSAQPTLAAVPMRRYGVPAAIGNGIPWTWARGLLIPAGGSIVLKNEALGSAVSFTVIYEE